MVQVVLPTLVRRIGKGCPLGSGLVAHRAQPVDPDACGVRGDGPDRPQVGSGAEAELFGGQCADTLDEAVIGESPTLVEACDTHGSATLTGEARSTSWRL